MEHMGDDDDPDYFEGGNANASRSGWSEVEDETLKQIVLADKNPVHQWARIAQLLGERRVGPERTGKQCRSRWLNFLDPSVKRGAWTEAEQRILFELHARVGNKWAKIAEHLPGRSDNQVKNFWYSTLRRSVRKIHKDVVAVGGASAAAVAEAIQGATSAGGLREDEEGEEDEQEAEENAPADAEGSGSSASSSSSTALAAGPASIIARASTSDEYSAPRYTAAFELLKKTVVKGGEKKTKLLMKGTKTGSSAAALMQTLSSLNADGSLASGASASSSAPAAPAPSSSSSTGAAAAPGGKPQTAEEGLAALEMLALMLPKSVMSVVNSSSATAKEGGFGANPKRTRQLTAEEAAAAEADRSKKRPRLQTEQFQAKGARPAPSLLSANNMGLLNAGSLSALFSPPGSSSSLVGSALLSSQHQGQLALGPPLDIQALLGQAMGSVNTSGSLGAGPFSALGNKAIIPALDDDEEDDVFAADGKVAEDEYKSDDESGAADDVDGRAGAAATAGQSKKPLKSKPQSGFGLLSSLVFGSSASQPEASGAQVLNRVAAAFQPGSFYIPSSLTAAPTQLDTLAMAASSQPSVSSSSSSAAEESSAATKVDRKRPNLSLNVNAGLSALAVPMMTMANADTKKFEFSAAGDVADQASMKALAAAPSVAAPPGPLTKGEPKDSFDFGPA